MAKTYHIQSLVRGLDVLDHLSRSAQPLSHSEISTRVGASGASVFRVLQTLDDQGWAVRDDRKRYRARLPGREGDALRPGLAAWRMVADAGREGATADAVSAATGLSGEGLAQTFAALAAAGLITGAPSGRWYLSPRLMERVRTVVADPALVEATATVMGRLAAETGETVSLFRRVGWEQVVVANAPSRQAVRYQVDVGASFPLYLGAAGKSALAELPPDAAADYLGALEPEAFTQFDLDLDVLLKELAVIRAQGFAISMGERIEGAAAVAAPIPGDGPFRGATLGVMMPFFRTSRGALRQLGGVLVSRIDAAFGSRADRGDAAMEDAS